MGLFHAAGVGGVGSRARKRGGVALARLIKAIETAIAATEPLAPDRRLQESLASFGRGVAVEA